MTNTEFVERVKAIAATNPTYREGGIGADGTCDCVGLIMGAMYALGHKKYDLHSSNYFARYETYDLVPLDDDPEINVGDIVYKARADTSKLNDRYMPGGTHCNGDFLDYYHVGVVTDTNPMEITHCTSTASVNGITYDGTTRGWTHVGAVKGITYDEEDDVPMEPYQATVKAPIGQTVNMRARPADGQTIVARVPVGTQVTVLESADGWAKIDYKGKYGYMMDKFLTQKTNETTGDFVTITIPKSAAQELYEALKEVAL